MAIVSMKKMNLLAMRSDSRPILRLLQRLSCAEIQMLTPQEREAYPHGDALSVSEEMEKKLAAVEWAIGALKKHVPPAKKGLLASFGSQKPQITQEECDRVLSGKAALLETVTAAEDCEKRVGELNAHAARCLAAIEQFRPWEGLDIPLERVVARRSFAMLMGQIPTGNLQYLREGTMSQAMPVELIEISQQRTTSSVLLFVHTHSMDALDGLLKQAEFAHAHFPGVQGTARQNIDMLESQLKHIDSQRAGLREEWARLAVNLPDLKVLHDLYQAERLRRQAASQLVETDQTFYLRAWVPAPKVESLVMQLCEIAPASAVEITDPLPEEKPPTVLRNSWFPSQFEGIVGGFSMPHPKGLDPSFMMAPFFACFFGMMLSDAGYGLLLALFIPLVIRIVKPRGSGRKLMWVLGLGGVFTVVWGVLFNTWFGAGIRPVLLDPMQQPLEMVALCLGMGMLHLFTAMGIGAYTNMKNGDPWAAVFDQFSWIAIIGGVVMLLLPGLLNVSDVWGTIGTALALTGLALVLLFAGRGKPFLKRIMGGLGALYGITGWLGDLLSYTRLFGMGLATGVVGMVINMMAGMIIRRGVVGLVLGVLVLVGGHAFNMTLNTLGAYVHSCRLQYIEFFGKFYQDGGLPFKPLHGETRYVDLSAADQ